MAATQILKCVLIDEKEDAVKSITAEHETKKQSGKLKKEGWNMMPMQWSHHNNKVSTRMSVNILIHPGHW